jgi:hypothetical protein
MAPRKQPESSNSSDEQTLSVLSILLKNTVLLLAASVNVFIYHVSEHREDTIVLQSRG